MTFSFLKEEGKNVGTAIWWVILPLQRQNHGASINQDINLIYIINFKENNLDKIRMSEFETRDGQIYFNFEEERETVQFDLSQR